MDKARERNDEGHREVVHILQSPGTSFGRLMSTFGQLQGSHRSWKTWKVMEFIISISRPGKSWNLGEGHGKSRKEICFLSDKKKITD